MVNTQTSTPTYRAQVAAEVAARYGVQCRPEVVQIIPTGKSAFFDGYGLMSSYSWRDQVNLFWERAKEDAARNRPEDAPRPISAANRATAIAAKKRSEQLRGDIERAMREGLSMKAAADRLGIPAPTLRHHVERLGLDWEKHIPGKYDRAALEPRLREAVQRLGSVKAAAAEFGISYGTLKKIATELGIMGWAWRASPNYGEKQGTPAERVEGGKDARKSRGVSA